MHLINRGIYYEDAYLGVTLGAILSTSGTIMIDAPLRVEDGRNWRSTLLNQRGGNNRLLVNLDSHPDRTLGARAIDCTIIAHQKTAHAFRNRPTIFKGQNAESGAVWESYTDAIGMRWSVPDITFSDRMSLHWGNSEIILEHHAGPTAGAIWAIIPSEKVIFVGDTVIAKQPPFLANADVEAWLESLEILHASYRDFILISGRGGPLPASAVRDQARALKNVLKGIERLAKRNAPAEATYGLIDGLLADFETSEEQRESFVQRLRYGLYHYYLRRYHPSKSNEEPLIEEDEQYPPAK